MKLDQEFLIEAFRLPSEEEPISEAVKDFHGRLMPDGTFVDTRGVPINVQASFTDEGNINTNPEQEDNNSKNSKSKNNSKQDRDAKRKIDREGGQDSQDKNKDQQHDSQENGQEQGGNQGQNNKGTSSSPSQQQGNAPRTSSGDTEMPHSTSSNDSTGSNGTPDQSRQGQNSNSNQEVKRVPPEKKKFYYDVASDKFYRWTGKKFIVTRKVPDEATSVRNKILGL